MTTGTNQSRREWAARGKYRGLYAYLRKLDGQEWEVSFSEIETILGFPLPPSARRHATWWANHREGLDHSQAVAWSEAGWDTTKVSLQTETLCFRKRPPDPSKTSTFDQIWPVRSIGTWPEGLLLSRKEMYD